VEPGRGGNFGRAKKLWSHHAWKEKKKKKKGHGGEKKPWKKKKGAGRLIRRGDQGNLVPFERGGECGVNL